MSTLTNVRQTLGNDLTEEFNTEVFNGTNSFQVFNDVEKEQLIFWHFQQKGNEGNFGNFKVEFSAGNKAVSRESAESPLAVTPVVTIDHSEWPHISEGPTVQPLED